MRIIDIKNTPLMTREQLFERIMMFLLWIIVFFSPTGPFLLAVGFFVICDLITGILAANARNEKIRSRKIARTVAKFIAYSIGILIAHVVNILFFPNFPALELMGGFIVFIEIKSVDENIKDITGYSLFKAILDKLKHKEEE